MWRNSMENHPHCNTGTKLRKTILYDLLLANENVLESAYLIISLLFEFLLYIQHCKWEVTYTTLFKYL